MPRRPDEPVRLTRIYTRGGDAGETSLGDGSRASKLDPLVRAYGAVDELNSILGWAQVEAADDTARTHPERALRRGRRPLRAVRRGRRQAADHAGGDRPARGRLRRGERRRCPSCSSFVLPGGSETARAPARRTGRPAAVPSARCWRCTAERPVNPLALVYLNRLSDLLFILARAANQGGGEPLWKPGG